MFSHLFGLHPWDVLRLTWRQYCTYREQADAYRRETNKSRPGVV